MTLNPIVIDPNISLLEVLHLMKVDNIRRLPVVAHGKLAGIVTKKDLIKTSSLTIYELNYLLAKTPVKEVMTKDPITVTPDTTIDEASVIIRDNQISGLPVVEDGKVVGIITETDLFDILVRLIDFRRGIRLTFYLENRVGAIAGLAEIFRKFNINIISIVVFEPVGREYEKEGNVKVSSISQVLKIYFREK